MDILGLLVGILSLCGTCFAIGYQFGKDSRSGESRRDDKTQNSRPLAKGLRLLLFV